MSNITTTTNEAATLNDEAQQIALFNLLIKTFSQCLDGFMWIAGNIGAICTCIVFYQPTFRKSPCAMFFIASSIAQIFVFNFAVFIRMIQYGYEVPVNSVSVWFCKIRYYIFYVAAANARYNIIFASVDRYFCSSRNFLLRQWSSSKVAFRLIVSNAIVWILVYIQVLVFFGLQNEKCRVTVTSIMRYYSFYITIENGLLPIVLMLLFGLLTIRNIHLSKRRVRETGQADGSHSTQIERVSSKETHLHKMLANQVILYMILNIPYPLYTIYRTYLSLPTLSTARALVDTFINNLLYDMIYLGYALTFPNFVITSGMFRRELRHIVQGKIRFCCRRSDAD